MKLAIASGKGGTGKTMVSVNLFALLAEQGLGSLIDCDVEAPNDALFVTPDIERQETVIKRVPRIDADRCTHCGACAKACEFHALAIAPKATLVFDELCHGCGHCSLVCPENAIREVDHPLGVVEWGTALGRPFAQGRLAIGEAMASPIIRYLRSAEGDVPWTLIDAPPGTACAVITAIAGVDGVILVTEPTPFGLHDLQASVKMCRALNLPMAVVVNRVGMGSTDLHAFCHTERLPILAEIAFDRDIASHIAQGGLLVHERAEWTVLFESIVHRAKEAFT